MSKIIFGSIQPNPKEAKVWLHPHDGLKTYNQKKQEWTGGGSSNDAPTDESESLYEFVDLGLPSGVLWATCNVGATKPEEYGLYFAWGETEGYEGITDGKKFNWADYKLCDGSNTGMTKYNTVDNLTTLELSDDAAYVSDKNCRMPIKADLEELTANTTCTGETLNGVDGTRFTSNINGNSIFVPAAGYCSDGSVNGIGAAGGLWSSSIQGNSTRSGQALIVSSVYALVDYGNRCDGFSIRPVQDPK